MKLLIVTQKVDRHDPILGFFIRWIEEFAQRCQHVTVIGQQVGDYELPHNVTVLSLKKESGLARDKQVQRFWWLAWKHRKDYDAVLVHMTPIWVALGGLLWWLLGKRVYLWYEARGGGLALPVSLWFARRVFGASDYGLPKQSKKHMITGHGIDTDFFRPDPTKRERGHIVAAGRYTTIKHFDVVLRAFAQLPEDCRLTLVGGTITSADKLVEKQLLALMHELNIQDRVTTGWSAPEQMPELFQRADCSLSACGGGLDKVVLQAMACGCPVAYTGKAADELLPEQCRALPETLAKAAEKLLALSANERQNLSDELRARVEQDHSLPRLIDRLVSAMNA